jgi:site-specific recombinase XerC
VRELLGHTSITTTVKFYAGLEHDAALKLYDQFLQESRNGAVAACAGGKR